LDQRCTVVGNSGDPWSFGQIVLRGYLRLPENLGGPLFLCLIAILGQKFFNLTTLYSIPPFCAPMHKIRKLSEKESMNEINNFLFDRQDKVLVV
jgi:hypothetical protein